MALDLTSHPFVLLLCASCAFSAMLLHMENQGYRRAAQTQEIQPIVTASRTGNRETEAIILQAGNSRRPPSLIQITRVARLLRGQVEELRRTEVLRQDRITENS